MREMDEAGIEVVFSSMDGKRFLDEKDFIEDIFKKLKVKFNHRKTVIADSGGTWVHRRFLRSLDIAADTTWATEPRAGRSTFPGISGKPLPDLPSRL